MKTKAILLLMSILCMLTLGGLAMDIGVTVDSVSGEVVIFGSTDFVNQIVTIAVVENGYDLSDTNKIVYIGFAQSGVNKKFKTRFKLSETAQDGEYTVFVGIGDDRFEDRFTYVKNAPLPDTFQGDGQEILSSTSILGDRVKIHGNTTAATVVTCIVIKPNSEILHYAAQTLANDEGIFEFEYCMEDTDEGGKYKTIVSGNNVKSNVISTFEFTNDTIRNQVVSLINAAKNEQTMANLLNDSELRASFLSMGFDLEAYDSFNDTQKSDVANKLYLSGHSHTQETVARTFNGAVAVNVVMASENEAQLLDSVVLYKSILEVDTSDVTPFGKANASVQNTILTALLHKNFASATEFKTEFATISLLKIMNNSNYMFIKEILNYYCDLLNINLYEYNKLNAVSRSVVDKTIVGREFGALDDFNKELQSAIEKAQQSSETQRPGSSGGSGSSSAVFEPVENPKQEEPQKNNVAFTDLDSVSWAKDSIMLLYQRNIVAGAGNGLFLPTENITREQFVKMLVLAFDLKGSDKEDVFSDVNKNEWYYDFVTVAYENGIVLGDENKCFGVGQPITRQDMAVMMHRIGKLGTTSVKEYFADDGDIAPYARESVYNLMKNGIINGTDNNKFEPQKNATRAEAAKMLAMLIKKREGI